MPTPYPQSSAKRFAPNMTILVQEFGFANLGHLTCIRSSHSMSAIGALVAQPQRRIWGGKQTLVYSADWITSIEESKSRTGLAGHADATW